MSSQKVLILLSKVTEARVKEVDSVDWRLQNSSGRRGGLSNIPTGSHSPLFLFLALADGL